MRADIAIAVIVAVFAVGAVWFFLLRPHPVIAPTVPAGAPAALAPEAATSTLGGSIYAKVQQQNAAQTSGAITNPANPFTGADTAQKSGYQNPFGRQ